MVNLNAECLPQDFCTSQFAKQSACVAFCSADILRGTIALWQPIAVFACVELCM